MRATDRILVAVGIVAAAALAAGAGAAAWLTWAYGTVEVEVRSSGPGGDDVSLRVPGVFARVAAEFIPADARRDVVHEIGVWLPVARVALSELSRCPDAHLVDVQSHGDRVRISKRGDVLLAEVRSRTEDVRVSIPLRAARSVLDGLGEPEDASRDARAE